MTILASIFVHSTSSPGIGWKGGLLSFITLIGLVGYAFGFRLGTILLWRAYAIIYAVLVLSKLAVPAVAQILNFPTAPFDIATLMFAMATMVTGLGLVMLALLRHAEMTGTKVTMEPTLAEVFS